MFYLVIDRVPSSTQLQMAGFISKHYQVPQKEKRTRGETQESLTSINWTTEASHKRCKSYNSNGFMHQAKSGNTPNEIKSTINKTDLKPQDKNPSKVRVPSSKGIRNDSFDNQLIKKSTTIDGMWKPTKESHLSKNKGNSSKFEASTKNYGWISDNDGVTSWSTWDLRKSTAYPTKSIMKGSSSKQANWNKSTSHKKNKSQNSSRIVSSRGNISCYNYNTNHSNVMKNKQQDNSIKKSDSENQFSMRYIYKQAKQKLSNYPSSSQIMK